MVLAGLGTVKWSRSEVIPPNFVCKCGDYRCELPLLVFETLPYRQEQGERKEERKRGTREKGQNTQHNQMLWRSNTGAHI